MKAPGTLRGLSACVLVALAGVLSCGLTTPAHAHETDQYSLPIDRPFADMGHYLDTVHCVALERVVERLNKQIDRALAMPPGRARDSALERLHDPERVIDLTAAQFSDAFTEILDIEHAVRGSWAESAYPGQITAHLSPNWIYQYTHFILDPRRLILLFQSSTIKAHGVYFGTDKLSHFHHMGRFYNDAYRASVGRGASKEEAVERFIATYSDSGIIAENALLGWVPTGVYSNADLAANYCGFKFYRNIIEPVMLEGELREPLVVRKGEHWRLNKHVRPESGWFGLFISDHWNEALNPPVYADAIMTSRVRALMRTRAEHIMAFYTTRDNRPAEAAYYDTLAAELTTLHGEEYGHRGGPDDILTLGNTCVPAAHEQALARAAEAERPRMVAYHVRQRVAR